MGSPHAQLPRLPRPGLSSSIPIASSSSLLLGEHDVHDHDQRHHIQLRLFDGRPGSLQRTQTSQYYDEPKVTHYLNVKDGGRFLFNIQIATSTVTSFTVVKVSTLVTCTGVFNVC